MALTNDIDIHDYYTIFLRDWWKISILAILGGLLGLVFSLINPPIYEARSTIITGIDYTSVDSKSWTDSKMDYVSNKSALIVTSSEIQNQLVADFKDKGISLSTEALSIERRISKWDLIVHHSDPQIAADVANAWQELAYQALDDARQNSLKVLETILKLDELQNCSKQVVQTEYCLGISNNIDLSEEIAILTAKLNTEERSSRGISVVVIFEKGNLAVTPVKPIVFNRNILVLIGLLIGLFTGVMLLMVRRK